MQEHDRMQRRVRAHEPVSIESSGPHEKRTLQVNREAGNRYRATTMANVAGQHIELR